MSLRLIAWLPVVLAVACKGPDVSSRSPLTDDETGVPDSRMVGVWQVFDDKAPKDVDNPPVGLVHFTQADGAQLGTVFTGSRKVRSRSEWLGAVSGQVAGRWYLSVQVRTEPSGGRGIEDFYIFRCDFENGDVLRLRPLSRPRVEAAVERGELRGREVALGEFRLTSSTDQLAAWIARQDPEGLFEPFILLRRVSLPVPFPPGNGNH